ncbi:DUF3024 domain-containing protein [Micromonospora sp. NBRC 101691]|uniref:DUF3024 domain-containing protein n=1 Tax=Micromonospora sp. NBRC 101691 TaxID=3032198 RepID=UPI0024A46259|nr:DUF3024 domain-containing protein [Micromonospora sp. NBRC 101691]GLY20428.1 hypothetical protein Misp04_01600 [Micromonospora sp. NBRC 101691]
MAGRGLPEAAVDQVRRWCAERVPERVRDQVRIACEEAPRHLTVVECRSPWNGDPGAEWTRLPVARFHYTRSTDTWTLYYRGRNLRFHRYDPAPPSADIGSLLAEVDRDPTAIFWG